MYIIVHMQNVSVAEARQKLPKLMNDAYFKSKSFTITRRGIPMARLTSVQTQVPKKSKYTPEQRAKAIAEVAGMWKNRWKGKSSVEVSRILREKAWKSHAR